MNSLPQDEGAPGAESLVLPRNMEPRRQTILTLISKTKISRVMNKYQI
jgi:hypothetical protein